MACINVIHGHGHSSGENLRCFLWQTEFLCLGKGLRWLTGSSTHLFLTLKKDAGWPTGCQTLLWRKERASKLGFLLRIPSGVGFDELHQGYYLNSGYYMTVFMVQPLQTMSAGAHGSHPHTQSSALVLWALSRLVPPGEPESSLCIMW